MMTRIKLYVCADLTILRSSCLLQARASKFLGSRAQGRRCRADERIENIISSPFILV